MNVNEVADPAQCRPPVDRPASFATFWEETLAELETISPRLDARPIQRLENGLTLSELAFSGLDDARIHGCLLSWRDGLPRPLVITTHGYIGQCNIAWDWAHAGLNVLCYDNPGYGRSHQALPYSHPAGYIFNGIESPQTSILRQAVCAYARAAELGRVLLDGQIIRTVYHGMSFGGALATMAAALTNTADLLAVAVPTFGWTEGRLALVRRGSGKEINDYLAQHPGQRASILHTLSFFDPMNFAEMIRCPTLIGVGMQDDIVPPETVYAIANHLTARNEIRHFPYSHSEEPEEAEWVRFETEWQHLALHGIPADFGRGPAAAWRR